MEIMIQVNIIDKTCERAALQDCVCGMDSETLRNLQSILNPVPPHLIGLEFWPENNIVVEYDPAIQKLEGETLTLDEENKIVNVTPIIVALTAEEVLQYYEALLLAKRQELSALRYEKEVSGVIVGGNLISTSRESQASMAIVHANLSFGFNGPTVSWNESGAFSELDVSQLGAILNEAFKYVQACRTNESVLSSALSVDINTDLTAGWPTREIS